MVLRGRSHDLYHLTSRDQGERIKSSRSLAELHRRHISRVCSATSSTKEDRTSPRPSPPSISANVPRYFLIQATRCGINRMIECTILPDQNNTPTASKPTPGYQSPITCFCLSSVFKLRNWLAIGLEPFALRWWSCRCKTFSTNSILIALVCVVSIAPVTSLDDKAYRGAEPTVVAPVQDRLAALGLPHLLQRPTVLNRGHDNHRSLN